MVAQVNPDYKFDYARIAIEAEVRDQKAEQEALTGALMISELEQILAKIRSEFGDIPIMGIKTFPGRETKFTEKKVNVLSRTGREGYFISFTSIDNDGPYSRNLLNMDG